MRINLKKRIAVIGGGAAGFVSAITASRLGADVTIYERSDRVLKKILATGNGRCNMTNMNAGRENYHGKNPDFIRSTVSRFWVSETLDFFSEIGVLAKTEKDGKVYPYSLQAAAVSDVLRFEAQRLKIRVICDFEVSKITKEKNGYHINDRERADAVIITTGGMASPQLGSNGSGYALAKKMGHKVTELYPSLVQVKTDNTYTKALQGLKVNAGVKFRDGKNVRFEDFGEVLFADYGLSGPPVFNLSRLASVYKNGVIVLDLMPEFDINTLDGMLRSRKRANVSLENYFTGMLPKKLGQVLLKSCGIAPLSRESVSLTNKEITALAERIKAWEFKVLGTKSWNNAQVTAGGVEVSDINPKTLESKLWKEVYFAGEVLDIDGDCGGYNLQWAWSSGYIAGMSAAGGGV